ncbi:uncharacterized protein LOC129764608 [Toxorhynchites rutilus septentrionalis]|uniref:uncharacterized protein LOC129764608 n=1 Tax=Toxorhynchites rutilus septentrionalis TaxID=329112 RepID=UPI00247876AB|nr:uncharacterized protein LOC129764608 [Toxorhynchites rutilus septentrionalis]
MSVDQDSLEPTLVTVRSLTYYEKKSLDRSLGSTSIPSTPVSIVSEKSCDKRKSLVYSDGLFSITLHHYDSIVSELKCPGCAQPLYGPIVLCQTGHSICAQCPKRLSTCPLCRKKLTEMRNYTLEAIAAKVHFPCMHSSRGCTVRLPPQLIMWHKERCGFKQVECFMGKVWENCAWVGSDKDWMDHCITGHQDKVYSSPDIVLTWNYALDSQKCIQLQSVIAYYVIRAYGQYFNVYQIYDQNSRKTIWTVICSAKETKTCQRFAFELELYSPIDSAKLLVQRFSCHAESDADFLKDGHCAKIPIDEAIRFMTTEKILYYRVRIIEVTPSRSRSLVLITQSQKLQSSSSTRQRQQLPIDYAATQIENVNMKAVPDTNIIVRSTYSPEESSPPTTDRISLSSSDPSTIKDEQQRSDSSDDGDGDDEPTIARARATSTPILNRVNSLPKPPRSHSRANPGGVESDSDQQLVRCRILDRYDDSSRIRTILNGETSPDKGDKATKASSESLSTPAKGLSRFYNLTTYKASKLLNRKSLK